jgi:hypothetical protein
VTCHASACLTRACRRRDCRERQAKTHWLAVEVAHFVEFLRFKTEEREVATATTKRSEQAFANVWDNPDDAEYDKL